MRRLIFIEFVWVCFLYCCLDSFVFIPSEQNSRCVSVSLFVRVNWASFVSDCCLVWSSKLSGQNGSALGSVWSSETGACPLESRHRHRKSTSPHYHRKVRIRRNEFNTLSQTTTIFMIFYIPYIFIIVIL